MLYRILFKEFLSNRRSYIRFFSTALGASILIFCFFSIYNMLWNVSGRKDTFFIDQNAYTIMVDGLKIVAVLVVFLMAFTLKDYVRSRIKSYSQYRLLGISRKDLKLMIGLEYIGSLVGALVIGIMIGVLIVWGLKGILQGYFPEKTLYMPNIISYLETFIVYMIVFVISMAVNREIFIEGNLSDIMSGDIPPRPVPFKRKSFLIATGVLLMISGPYLFGQKMWGEDIVWVLLMELGILLIILFGGDVSLGKIRKREKYYYKHLVLFNRFSYFWSSKVQYIIILHFIQLMLLFYFPMQSFSAFPLETENLYPYDFICKFIPDEAGEQMLENLEKECKAEYEVIPAMTLTVLKGDSTNLDRKYLYNQGQNLVVSASAYNKLTGENVKLEDDEMIIIYQQMKGDKSHPLDWYGSRIRPYYYYGMPIIFEWDRYKSVTFHDKTPIREERVVVTGYYGEGCGENLIVFSDEAYEYAESDEYKEMKSDMKRYWDVGEKEVALKNLDRNRLVLLKVPKQYRNKADEVLNDYQALYPEETNYSAKVNLYYSSERSRDNMLTDMLLRTVINVLLFIAFLLSVLLLEFIIASSEIPYMQKRYQYLNCMGLTLREQKNILLRELYITILLPLIGAVAFGGYFTHVVLELRQFNNIEYQAYLKKWGMVTMVVVVLQLFMTVLMRGYILRKVGVKDDDHRSK